MLVIDTNILIYASDPDSDVHEVCRDLVDEYRQGASPWFISWPICYEFLRVVTHPAIPRKPWTATAAWQFLETILNSPSGDILLPTSRHATILAEILAQTQHLRGNIFYDLHTVVLMREHGIREICTRDTDFHRFPGVTVIDPAR